MHYIVGAMRRYKIIVAGYNCEKYVDRCIESIASQTYTNYDVCLVDDASTDGTADIVVTAGNALGWNVIVRDENAGALRSQHEGITVMSPEDGEVVVWVDMDDALATCESLRILDSYYDDDTLMTYGSYVSVPHSESCPQPARYPEICERKNDYRNMHKWGIQYNHLRSVRWELYKQLVPEVDFFYKGEWMNLASDTAVMIPCLEMSGGHYKFIEETLYAYTSDNPRSEWRKAPRGTDDMHNHLIHMKRKSTVIL